MRLPHNVDRSAFRPGEYVIYDGRGNIWHGKRAARGWTARPAPNNPARCLGEVFEDDTLTGLAHSLANRRAGAVVTPF